MKNIVETAIEAGSFKKLVEAVRAAGLAETLSGSKAFRELTVFAPDDSAFDKLPQNTWRDLLADKERLRQVLTYHVVPGKVMSSDLSNMASVNTLQGQNLSIDTSGGVRVGKARVKKADIECSNGVIHVIDSVLMPQRIETGMPA